MLWVLSVPEVHGGPALSWPRGDRGTLGPLPTQLPAAGGQAPARKALGEGDPCARVSRSKLSPQSPSRSRWPEGLGGLDLSQKEPRRWATGSC